MRAPDPYDFEEGEGFSKLSRKDNLTVSQLHSNDDSLNFSGAWLH